MRQRKTLRLPSLSPPSFLLLPLVTTSHLASDPRTERHISSWGGWYQNTNLAKCDFVTRFIGV